jgi:hypothetical protein
LFPWPPHHFSFCIFRASIWDITSSPSQPTIEYISWNFSLIVQNNMIEQYITTKDTNIYPVRMHILEEFKTKKTKHKGKVKTAK